MSKIKAIVPFSGYQKLVVAILSVVQFTVVLDFMVMAPLGDLLMKTMGLTAKQFATAVSVYAFSAGISGLLAAGFADKYDRKKLLVFFYIGFIVGTLLCATAGSYHLLLFGRIITGIFGGVLGSISMAIVTDLFAFEQRGRVMGFVQMSFAVSQVAGIPFGLLLANELGWQAPFMLIVIVSVLTVMVIGKFLKPIDVHIKAQTESNPFSHLQKTVTHRYYLMPYVTTALLSIGGFMLMPFSTAFVINNVGVLQEELPLIYVVTGISSLVILPLIGRISDRTGKLPTFLGGTLIALVMVYIYTHLSITPLWELIVINTIMFAGIMSRMIPSSALMTAIPKLEDRGAFMSVNSSLQQISGGVASVIAGFIIVQDNTGHIYRFNVLGYVAMGVMVICAILMIIINRRVERKLLKSEKPEAVLVEV